MFCSLKLRCRGSGNDEERVQRLARNTDGCINKIQTDGRRDAFRRHAPSTYVVRTTSCT